MKERISEIKKKIDEIKKREDFLSTFKIDQQNSKTDIDLYSKYKIETERISTESKATIEKLEGSRDLSKIYFHLDMDGEFAL